MERSQTFSRLRGPVGSSADSSVLSVSLADAGARQGFSSELGAGADGLRAQEASSLRDPRVSAVEGSGACTGCIGYLCGFLRVLF